MKDWRDPDVKVFVIAEIGNNHEGRFEVAQELVHRAAASGVHAVKFQTFKTEKFIRETEASRFRRMKSFELSESQFAELGQLARSLGLSFICTPFDLDSAVFLNGIVDCFKIASGDNDFYALIKCVLGFDKPVLISSGGCDLAHLEKLLYFIKTDCGASIDRLAILHCVSCYPVPFDEVNLRSIPFLQEHLRLTVGYSDHTVGVEASVNAVALGARIVEKHFTLDKHFSDFRDHQLSADPQEMSELVQRIATTSAMLGQWGKTVQMCEEAVLPAMRRSIVAGTPLPYGHRIDYGDLKWLRPAGVLSPGSEHLLVGRILKRAVQAGEPLTLEDVT